MNKKKRIFIVGANICIVQTVVVEELSREELRQVIISRFPLLEPLIEKILRQGSHRLKWD